ncbi:MAG: ATP-binding protein [Candidatus Poribacteria bacterium]|nr:ATP-binding protein [Candidatus Poribacteria bacterium]
MALGIIFGETSTQEFSFLFGDAGSERQNQLKFSYVEVGLPESKDKVVAKVVDVNTENPLLAKDTAKFYSEHETLGISVPDIISHRFTLYQAKCEVMGVYNNTTNKIAPLTQAIKPGEKVNILSDDILIELFSESEPWYLSLGHVEIPGRETQAQVSLDADSIVTMHAGIFGMTGMGKTTTTAVILEELMFRGAKTIIFDPHGDYVNLNQIRRKLYDAFKLKIENDPDLIKRISGYKNHLKEEFPELPDFYSEQVNMELMDENIFYRLFNFCLIKNRDLMVDLDDSDDSASIPEELLDSIINKIKQLDWENELPQELVSRMLALNLNAYPQIKMYPDKSPYFTMRLIEAMASENFTPAQIGHIIPWLQVLDNEQREELHDVCLLNHLIGEVNGLPPRDPSKDALNRILNRAKLTVKNLKKRDCRTMNISDFVNAFCSKGGSMSHVSTAVFNLSDLENNQVRRALVYAVMEFAFDRYKSKDFDIDKNAHPILFALEEARTLIPRQDESSSSGEINPATRAARFAAQQIATEGRKMGLGMLVISQKPASVDSLTTSQANTLILHRVINPDDQSYIRDVGESLSNEDLEILKTVKEGVAIVTGDALKTRMSPLVKVRNRYSEPGAERPRPIQKKWQE